MFETAELGQKMGRKEFKNRETLLRSDLLDLQHQLKVAGKSVIIICAGLPGSGRSETVNTLAYWLDPRGLRVHAHRPPTDEESQRPFLWRYWLQLPPVGGIGIFLGSWYSELIQGRAHGEIGERDLEQKLQEILSFERTMSDDRVVILKFWLHLTRSDLKRRLKTLSKNPATRWRVTRESWKCHENYQEYKAVAESVIRKTTTGHSAWRVIEATNSNFRHIMVGTQLRDVLNQRIESALSAQKPTASKVHPLRERQVGILSTLDYTTVVPQEKYRVELPLLQARLHKHAERIYRQKKTSVVIVFEGPDAGGKGGAIRRLTGAMDAPHYRVVSVAAPTQEELSYPYLWRFWKYLPRRGHIAIFDRSWYGRVLVEPIEGFCSEQEWRNAYREINEFESHLESDGIQVIKFWLATTKEEQLARFREREKISYKRHKITEEDWRNREKWDLYGALVHKMVEQTSTITAPWHLIPGNDKRYTRLEVVRRVCEAIEKKTR